MKASANMSIHLSDGGREPRAVAIRTGVGCNLWLESICVTAATAKQFRELAAAALDAAVIQEGADARKRAPHEFIVNDFMRVLGAGAPCDVCGEKASDERHAVTQEARP